MASSVIDNGWMDAIGIISVILGVAVISAPIIFVVYVILKILDNR